MDEYVELADSLVKRIEAINARLEQEQDFESLRCLSVAIADVDRYLRGLALMTALKQATP